MKFLFLLITFFFGSHLNAQDPSRTQDSTSVSVDTLNVVDTILIVGNTHTKEYVIRREMSLQLGTRVTKELLEYEQERIYSLGLFTRVQIHIVPSTPGKITVVVEVNERWYIFPFPIFGIRDRDWKKVYYGVSLLHANFRGRNEKLYGTLILGYNPAVGLSYRTPFLTLDGAYLGEARVLYQKVRNLSLVAQNGLNNFDERHFSASLSMGKRFNLEYTVWLTLAYEMVDISEYKPGRTISTSGKDKYPFLAMSCTYDTRDLFEYPSRGMFGRFSVKKYGFPGQQMDIVRYATDLRGYTSLISKFILTGRIFSDIVTAGRTPSYNRVYFGYGERIRGHFKEVREGENLFGLSTELHYPLLAPMYFNFDFLPAEFSILKFGVVAAIFADAGTVWFRHHPFALGTFTKGYGFGIHFLLPYSMVLRTDYAWNEIRRGEFILDLGTSF